jgi:hypothetical protein
MNDTTKDELDLDGQAAQIKKGIDHLLVACKKKDKSRIIYWVGLLAREMTGLGRDALGLTQPKKRSVIMPGENLH